MVEYLLAKEKVAGSSPVRRSFFDPLTNPKKKILGSSVMVTRQSLELVTLGSNPSSPTQVIKEKSVTIFLPT